MNTINQQSTVYFNKPTVSKSIASSPTFGFQNQKQNVFAHFDRFTKYSKNTDSTKFIKDYLAKHFREKNIQIPQGLKIDIIQPIGLDNKIKTEINNVVFNHFKGYVKDVFRLLSLPKNKFEQKVATLKVPVEAKNSLHDIYDYIHHYYQIKLSLPGQKSLSLKDLNSTQQSLELKRYFMEHPRFCKDIVDVSHNIEQLSVKFGLSEISRQVMYESGQAARDHVNEFIIGVLAIIGMDQFLVPPLAKAANGMKAGMGHFIENTVTPFIAGFDDDTLGSIKDKHQDELVIGKENSKKVMTATIAAGIILSIAALKYNPVTKANAGKLAPALKYAFLTAGGLFTSTALTFASMFKQIDSNVKNGLIQVPQKAKTGLKNFMFKLGKTWDNFQSYDVYLGKTIGFASILPITLAAVKSGAMTSNNKVVKALTLILLGSAESYMATAFQLVRDTARKARIKSSQQHIVENLTHHDHYDPASLSLKGTKAGSFIGKDINNFIGLFVKGK